MGGADLRKSLYVCAMAAFIKNKSCKDMYIRMKEKGKPGKVIIVAIMNNLIRQIVAIVKNQTKFDPNFA